MNNAAVSINNHQANRIEWQLYTKMLTTRVFEEALVRWEHEGKHSAQTFPSKGQEAIAIGTCLALGKRRRRAAVVSHPRRDDRHGNQSR